MSESKVFYISPYFWPEAIGSAPYATEVAQWLAERGNRVTVLAFRPHYPSVAAFATWQDGARDAETLEGMTIFRVPVRDRSSGGFRDRLKNDLGFLRHGIGRAFSDEVAGTDAVVAYVPTCLSLFVAQVVKWRTGARIVGVVHDVESGLASALGIARRPWLLAAMRRVERLAFNCADRMIVLTDGIGRELRRIGYAGDVVTLPIWAEPAGPAEPPPAESPVVMYSGNFGKKQNLDQLLPLIRLLDQRRPAVRVRLQGDGSERPRIERRLAELAVTNTTTGGLVPSERLIASLQSAAVHLVPQALDVADYALPSKLFTVMAAGRPFVCIAEAGSPLDELAQRSGAGLCVGPGNDEALFEAVAGLVDDPALVAEMGARGQRFVARHMSRQTILAEYERIVLDAPAEARGPAAQEDGLAG